MPYAHKYANAVTSWYNRHVETIRTGNFFRFLIQRRCAYLSKDYLAIMELLIDSEMKMFKGINTPLCFAKCDYRPVAGPESA
jgi:hypothetical protein